MKTALKQLIDNLISKYGSNNDFINEAITDAILLQKAEKEQIIKSYKEGQNNGYCDGCTSIETAEDYYTQTFKSDE